MKKPTISNETLSDYREWVQRRVSKRVLQAIELAMAEELDEALGCRAYERVEGRQGYRNGVEARRVTTAVGTRELRVPRGRLRDEGTGETKEFRSALLSRYARRARQVDEAILGRTCRERTAPKARASTFSSSSPESSPRFQSLENMAFTTFAPTLRGHGFSRKSTAFPFTPSVTTTAQNPRPNPSSRQKSAPLSEKVGRGSSNGSIKLTL